METISRIYRDINGIELESINCIFCGCIENTVLFSGSDRLHKKPGAFNVVRCKTCGLVYTNPRPSLSQMGLYYPVEYGPHGDATDQDIQINIGFMNKGKNRLDKFKNWMKGIILDQYYGYDPEVIFGVSIPKSGLLRRSLKYVMFPFSFYVKNLYYKIPRNVTEGKVMDVGCGNGGYIMLLKKMGWEVYGIDISTNALEKIKPDAKTHVLTGELIEQDLPENQFDLVTMWHSLEHMRDPREILRKIYSITKPGGKLLLCVPNYANVIAKLFRQRWFALDLPRHLFHFTPVMLKKMLLSAGFQVNSVRYIPFNTSFPVSLEYWLEEKHLRKIDINKNKILRRMFRWVIRSLALIHQSEVVFVEARKG
jgi:2-polyprenyl-3-methyl-5-hydroxy-6-metoxy-1,4-benzoquinol methylase